MYGLLHFFFWPIILDQPISCFSSLAMQCLSTSPRTKSLFAEDVFSTWTRTPHCFRCCGLCLEITSLFCYASLQRPDEAGENRYHVFFHIIVENDQAELEPKIARDSELELVTPTWPTVQHTCARGLGNSGNDVFLAARLQVPELLFPALVGVDILDLCVKKFQQKKKPTARP